MNNDPTELASAYLDDQVTNGERAMVDTDPTLLAEVERLRAVRLLLANVEPAKISVREAQLAAAFDVWERQGDATPTTIDRSATGSAPGSSPGRRSDRRRTMSTRWLTGAAAALALVAVGGVALQSVGSGNDDSAATETADDASAAIEASDATDATNDDATRVAAADEALASDAEAAESDDSVQLDTAVGDPAPPREEAQLQQLFTTQDLADFAAPAFGAPRAPDAPAATSAPVDTVVTEGAILELTLCLGADIVVGPAVFGDVLVVVGIDEGRSLALAYRPETCSEVARVSLDTP